MEPALIALLLNEFTHIGSLSSILPYLGIYYLNYTNSSVEDFGLLLFLVILTSIILNFGLHSLNIRHETYTLSYFATWTLAMFSFTALFIPLIFVKPQGGSDSRPEVESQLLFDAPEAAQDPKWSYIVNAFVALGLIATILSQQTCYQINSRLVLQLDASSSWIRVWGCAGAVIAQVSLRTMNTTEDLLFLVPILLTYTIFALVNLIIRTAFYFDEPLQELVDSELSGEDGTVFYQSKKYWFRRKVVKKQKEGIWFVGADTNFGFDTKDDEYFRNIRRCSLAPLGDSYQIKQFELANKTEQHFNHVTKIEPREKDCSEVPTVEYDIERIQEYFKYNIEDSYEVNYKLGFYIELIKLVLRNNRFYLRIWLLIAFNGYFIASKNNYLALSLYSKDATKFKHLGPFIILASFLGQALTNVPLLSNYLACFKYSTSFSLIFLLQSFSFFLFAAYSSCLNNNFLQEYLVISELLLSVHSGWFAKLLDSLILSYTREVRHCIDNLVELGRINDYEETRRKIESNLKMFIINLSMGVLFPLGMALGSLIGGLAINRYGHVSFWSSNTLLAVLVGVVNYLSSIK